MEIAARYLDEVVAAAKAVDLREVEKAVALLEAAYRDGRTVFVTGNGGSAANAMHFAQDLSKGSVPDLEGKRLKVMSLVDNVSMLTALSNDVGYERVFDLQLRPFAQAGDILVAISGSGKSPNILRAVDYAKSQSLKVIGLTGFDGGKLMKKSDVRLHVPLNDMCKSEAVHSILLHMMADLLRARLAPGKKC